MNVYRLLVPFEHNFSCIIWEYACTFDEIPILISSTWNEHFFFVGGVDVVGGGAGATSTLSKFDLFLLSRSLVKKLIDWNGPNVKKLHFFRTLPIARGSLFSAGHCCDNCGNGAMTQPRHNTGSIENNFGELFFLFPHKQEATTSEIAHLRTPVWSTRLDIHVHVPLSWHIMIYPMQCRSLDITGYLRSNPVKSVWNWPSYQLKVVFFFVSIFCSGDFTQVHGVPGSCV